MAKQFVDAAVTTEKEDMSIQDGTSLTLTNSVRILYDDTLDTATLITTINRIRDKILEHEE